jgi:hypothetical protein
MIILKCLWVTWVKGTTVLIILYDTFKFARLFIKVIPAINVNEFETWLETFPVK